MRVLVVEATVFDHIKPGKIDDQAIQEAIEALADYPKASSYFDTVTHHWETIEE